MKKHDLLIYVPTGIVPINVLTVDSSAYLPKLREKLPNSRLFAATSEDDDNGAYSRLKVERKIIDCRKDKLPFADGFFDIIIAGECLTYSFLPYDTVLDIGRKLKDTGFMVTEFLNVRYHKVLEGLKGGRFDSWEKRFWTKHDAVKLFNDAVFKEIDFAFGERDEKPHEGGYWEEYGFDNFSHDLSTKSWILKAARSKASVCALKSLYTPQVRRELARILHRIEYDVNREENIAALKDLMAKEVIFPEYLMDFIDETCIHRSLVKKFVRLNT